jgi:hypothetical protein
MQERAAFTTDELYDIAARLRIAGDKEASTAILSLLSAWQWEARERRATPTPAE